jgi:cation diffusion facilitator CzcD-associated flavoprotein CzcO
LAKTLHEPDFDVVIVGAGFAGMYLLHRARAQGMSVRVLEAGSGVGGTWYWNRYPGARCDVESMQYSYQFDEQLQAEWNWSERYAPQPEILRYAEHVAERLDLAPDIQFDTRVATANYDAEGKFWTLTSTVGTSVSGRYYVMATGCLSMPNWPQIPGLDCFAGDTYHTAQWPHTPVDFKGKRVAIIGTGSSSIQSIPLIASEAESLLVFQRTANYSIPARNAALTRAHIDAVKSDYPALRARAKQTFPGIDGPFNAEPAMAVSESQRQAEYEQRWQRGGLTFMGAYGDLMFDQAANDTLADFVRNKIRTIVDHPEVAETLCPTNIIGGKRLCVDTNYYATFNRENVSLIDVKKNPIDAIDATGLQLGGRHYDIDILIIATGFDAMTGAISSVDIQGKNGERLQQLWQHGPCSYLGLAMAGFPNLFTVTGPGSPSVFTNMLPTIEQHVDWIAACLQYMSTQNHQEIEATVAAQDTWWQHVQEAAKMGLKSSTESWYMGANVAGKARVFMPYYGGFPAYCAKCEEVVANDYEGFVFS